MQDFELWLVVDEHGDSACGMSRELAQEGDVGGEEGTAEQVTQIPLDLNSTKDYALFLRIKSLPRYRFAGRVAEVPDEYAGTLGLVPSQAIAANYSPLPSLFDYQRAISALAIRRKKFAVFMEPGLGKTLIDFEFSRHAMAQTGKLALLVSPPNVIRQMIQEFQRFYPGETAPEHVRAAGLGEWLSRPGKRFGITNYEAIRGGLTGRNLGALILSESSMLKSMYGTWGTRLIELGRGLEWKLCETGTPAPNDRIEYANHAVFLDQSLTTNAFLARYFVNRGQTDERWELKPHALRPFYKSLSHWCIFVSNPATYGWKDNVGTIPPVHVHIHDVPMTRKQKDLVIHAGGDMYGSPGGITSRAKLSQLAKGTYKGSKVSTRKPRFIADLASQWPDESTLIWCLFNNEQDSIDRAFPGAASLRGSTKESDRDRMIDGFKSGEIKTLISKPKCLGFGLNLQRATRQIFSGLCDSYESYYQCVKRSNRVGSTLPLNVHIPVTEIERAMIDTVMRKAHRIEQDTREQEQIFKESSYAW